jgi:acyl dehydratase
LLGEKLPAGGVSPDELYCLFHRRAGTEYRIDAEFVEFLAVLVGDDTTDEYESVLKGVILLKAVDNFRYECVVSTRKNRDTEDFDIGSDIQYERYGEQYYKFERPVYVGDILSATTTLADAFEREGRDGNILTFAVLETECVDKAGELVVTERETLIETDSPLSRDGRRPESLDWDATSGAVVCQPTADSYPLESAAEASVGDEGPTTIVGEITPQDFVRYAGASGEFNPIHYDAEYTTALGNESVFGQEMLTAGYAGRFLSDWFGVEALRRFRTRFTARVWPGDTLIIRGEITDVDAPEVTVELTESRQTGETVLQGDATATVSPAGPTG